MKLLKIRFLALCPALCAIVSFILTMLCIFAGSHPGYLEDTDLVTLNTSMIGIHAFGSSSNSHSNGSDGGGLLGSLRLGASSISDDLGNDIENELNKGIQDIAKKLNISDFYSWHLLDFCQGFYEPGAQINASDLDPWKNVTACSNRTGFYTFNATQMLQSSLRAGVNLTQLDWPSGMEDAIDTVVGAARAMFVLYCMGAAIAGLAMFTGLVAVLTNGTLAALVNAGLSFLGFLALGLASSLSTSVIDKVVDAVAEVGADVGIEAIPGTKFIALTWVATLMMGLAGMGWVVDFFLGKRRLAGVVPEKGES